MEGRSHFVMMYVLANTLWNVCFLISSTWTNRKKATILEVRDNLKLLNDWEVERLTDFYNAWEQFKDFTDDDSLFLLKDKHVNASIVNLHVSGKSRFPSSMLPLSICIKCFHNTILNQRFGLGR